MKIAFDARAYGWTGIGRYIRNLLRQYRDVAHDDQFAVFAGRGQKEKIVKELGLASPRFSVVEVTPRYYSWPEQVVLPMQLMAIKPDLWHFTHFNVPVVFTRPFVVTIHDATRFVFPGQRRQDWLDQAAYEWVFASALKHARAAIFVSQATRQEVERLPLSLPSALKVIYEGVDEQFSGAVPPEKIQQLRDRLGVGNNPYLLYVGVWMRHKNLWRLLQAFALLRSSHPQLHLVLTGRAKGGYSAVEKWVQELGLQASVHLVGFVEHGDLPALYAGATVFVFPSLYEGFGLPALEAAASGVPVVASNVSSLPEVMGEGAVYVNPEDEADIARGIERALEMRAKHLLTSEFSWPRCAQETLALYRRVGTR